jgi:hypothetical protein
MDCKILEVSSETIDSTRSTNNLFFSLSSRLDYSPTPFSKKYFSFFSSSELALHNIKFSCYFSGCVSPVATTIMPPIIEDIIHV